MTTFARAALAATLALAGAASFAALASAQDAPPPISDKAFVMKASVGNSFEIEESQIALQKATDPKLKEFAQHMIDDHTKALHDLQDAAKGAGLQAQMMLDAPHQAMLDNLKSQSGADFDKIYTADQVAGHNETAALLADYQQNGKTDALTTWVKNTLPGVKGHLASINGMAVL